MSEEELRAELGARVKQLQRRSSNLASLTAGEADCTTPGEQRLFRDLQAQQVGSWAALPWSGWVHLWRQASRCCCRRAAAAVPCRLRQLRGDSPPPRALPLPLLPLPCRCRRA